jgi:glutamate N-acetyltransferase/amino-acid N-acetyltransferase
MHPVSPLAPTQFPDLPPVSGLRMATGMSGIRYRNRPDLLVMAFAEGTQAAGVFTQSLTASAPVLACRAALKTGRGALLIANAGNSNAFTGRCGEASVDRMKSGAAAVFGCKAEEVYVASTGVIGQPLPDEKITALYPALQKDLHESGWMDAARAIMTTDTFPKLATKSCVIDGAKVTLNGIAKGSGMIAPDMATLFAFVFTDANIAHEALQPLFARAIDESFNAITVDGDTSTSDTALCFATCMAGNARIENTGIPDFADSRIRVFYDALRDVLLDLAKQVVKDGEGARKFITIHVNGAESDEAARRIGLTVGNSPLVKTAIAGEDANWGRIVAAVGRSGQKADRDRLGITIGGVQVAKNGEVVPGYDETPVAAHMKGDHIEIGIEIGIGKGRATVYTCDLTHGYIDINGSYRT